MRGFRGNREPSRAAESLFLLPLLASLTFGCALAAPSRAAPPRPPVMPAATERVPVIEERTAAGEVTVLVARRDGPPIASVQLAFSAGYGDDPKEKAGLAAVSFQLLADHAKKVALLDDSPAGFGSLDAPWVTIEADGAGVGATVLVDEVELVIRRLARALETLSVDEEALSRAARRAASSASGRRTHSRVAETMIARSVLGDSDVLSMPAAGTPLSRSRITPDDIEQFLSRTVITGESAVIVAGPVDTDEIQAMAAAHLGDWAAAGAADRESTRSRHVEQARAVAATPAGSNEGSRGGSPFFTALFRSSSKHRSSRPSSLPVVHASTGGSPRLVVALASPAAPADAKGEAALRLAEQALGGALRYQLREKTQLSYRVGHDLTLHRAGGLLSASAFMEAGDAPRAERAAQRAILDATGWLRDGRGFESIRSASLHALLEELDTVCSLGAATARLYQRGLPTTHYLDVARALESAPSAHATDALERLLDPDVARILFIGEI